MSTASALLAMLAFLAITVIVLAVTLPTNPDSVTVQVTDIDPEPGPSSTLNLSGDATLTEGKTYARVLTIETDVPFGPGNIVISFARSGGPPVAIIIDGQTHYLTDDGDTTDITMVVGENATATSMDVTFSVDTDEVYTGDGTVTVSGAWQAAAG